MPPARLPHPNGPHCILNATRLTRDRRDQSHVKTNPTQPKYLIDGNCHRAVPATEKFGRLVLIKQLIDTSAGESEVLRIALTMSVLLLAGPALGNDGWMPLFNGKDLTGWRANRDPQAFTVQEGVLRVQSSSEVRAHLFYIGDRKEGFETFTNFELEATVQAEPNSNGGIFLHTDMTTRDARQHLAKGYEVQLNSSEKDKRKTGSLYAIIDLDASPVDETKWFVVRVVVQGKRIVISLDGKPVVDYTEPDDVVRPEERASRLFSPDGGAIALQAHDASSVWYFKDIRIKRLP